MKLIGITSRVDVIQSYNERRDAIDQRWLGFFKQAGYLPLFIPNNLDLVKHYIKNFNFSGFVLSGGNNHQNQQGDAPERDEMDDFLIAFSIQNEIPVIGVCRGMQSIQIYHGISLKKVEGHVSSAMDIAVNGSKAIKNSYHNWGSCEISSPLSGWAQSEDGVIKAIKHDDMPMYGIMWHPERECPYSESDIQFFKSVFN